MLKENSFTIQSDYMGLFKFFTSCSHDKEPQTIIKYVTEEVTQNPNPRKFVIRKTKRVGKFLLAEISYPDCTNYEGRKILIYENINETQLRKLKFLDPHFCDGKHISPLARFEPTDRGWQYASIFAEHASDVMYELWQQVKDVFEKELNQSYKEKMRFYHTLSHIEDMFKEYEWIKDKIVCKITFILGIWLHDSVYDPTKRNNEELSAIQGALILKKYGLSSLIPKVTEHILATRHQEEPIDSDAKYLVDIDIAIFGKSEKKFDEYECNITKEYAFLAKNEFAYYRKIVLQKFINRPRIYYTDYFRDKYEVQARKNLRRSIQTLTPLAQTFKPKHS
jgi:predicted metal-dependent HD superfamily phosphohydrolase